MAVRSDNRQWVRKLDGDMHVVPEQPELRLYPTGPGDDLDEVLLSLTRAREHHPKNPQARACGSHWSASKAAACPDVMIETATPVHEPGGDQTTGRLNKVLYNVIPSCLSEKALRFFQSQNCPKFDPSAKPSLKEIYLFHVETGMRIYELYARLDGLDGKDEMAIAGSLARVASSMNATNPVPDYSGPWALETMGGAGGQTIGGVISTATHGGDVDYGAIGDSVVAMHVIDQNGQHHWIERTRIRPSTIPMDLTDEAKLQGVFPRIQHHRDDDMFNAAIVACGRMGLIYSVVLRVVRQYALKESLAQFDWNAGKALLANPGSPVWKNRFVRLDVNAYGGPVHPKDYDCYLFTRSLEKLDAAGSPDPLGRAERGGANAGRQPSLGTGDGWFSDPCGSDNYIRTALAKIRHDFVLARTQAIKSFAKASAVLLVPFLTPFLRANAIAAQGAALAAMVATTALINAVTLILELIGSSTARFGDTLAAVSNFCADHGLFLIYRAIYEAVQGDQHEAKGTAISYAVMDDHNYLNVGCVAPGDTIEFFFDADSAALPAFIDHVLARVRQLENGELGDPAVFGGYISLRFMTQSEALLAMQRWPRTCSIEIAGLSRINGTDILISTLAGDAKSFDTVLHWGQHNTWGQKEIEKIWSPMGAAGELFKWRRALSMLSKHGRLAMFSTAFTREKGLEITDPIIASFSVTPTEACFDELLNATWEAQDNPPETEAFIIHTHANGSAARIPLDGLSGDRALTLGKGRSTVTLRLERRLNGNLYVDERDLQVRGFQPGDPWTFQLEAGQRLVDGATRWAVEINLFSQFISNVLQVSSVQSTFGAVPAWRLRNPDAGDVAFTAAANTQPLPGLPKFNTRWLLFSEAPATAGAAPNVVITFTLACAH
jgi:hypothetical protein